MQGKEPIITFTDDRCVLGDTSYPDIPLLINYDCRIIEVASDWLRHLMMRRRKIASSVRQYAYHLKYWWGHLNRAGIAWDEVDDHIMLRWRDQCLHKSDPGTVNSYVSTVFRMYLWAEKNGYTNRLIGEADFERKIRPPLSVEVKSGKHGIKTYSSPLLVRTVAKPLLSTPTNAQITKIHDAFAKIYGDNTDLMIRDCLILTWEEMTGVRRAEVLSLKRSQIPSWAKIRLLEEKEETHEITIVGKGGKKRVIWASVELLDQTRDYIEEERKAIISRFHSRLGPSYRYPDEIFLSSKTGRPLHPDTVSQMFAKAFREAGVRGSGHRVRARFLTNFVETILERAYEKLGSLPDLTITLLPAAQIAGHSDVKTLRPYLALALKRLTGMTNAERKAVAEEKAIAAERRLGVLQARLRKYRAAVKLVRAITSKDDRKSAKAMLESGAIEGMLENKVGGNQ